MTLSEQGFFPVSVCKQSIKKTQNDFIEMDVEPYIQSITHPDAAAFIGEVEAQQIVAVQQADWVVRNRDAAPLASAEKMFLINVNRFTQELGHLLREGLPLKACREALEQAFHPQAWKTRDGALIFVHPEQYQLVLRSFDRLAFELKPSHIIFTESLEHLLEETFDQCTSKGAWAKSRVHFEGDSADLWSSRAAASSNSAEGATQQETGAEDEDRFVTWRIIEVNTFLQVFGSSSSQISARTI